MSPPPPITPLSGLLTQAVPIWQSLMTVWGILKTSIQGAWVQSFFSYFGSKSSIAREYYGPGNRVVVEPFAGAAGYSTYHNVKIAYLFDLYPVVFETWQFLIDAANGVGGNREILENLEPGPYYKWDRKIPENLPPGARHLIGFWETQSQTYPSSWQQSPRIDEDKKHRPKNRGGVWTESTKRRILKQLDGIKDWRVFQASYEESIGTLKAANVDLKNTIWHIDPPYQNGGLRYKKSSKAIDFDRLKNWVITDLRAEGPRIMVCERDPAEWLDFKHLFDAKNASNKEYKELVWYSGWGEYEGLSLFAAQ